MNARSLFAMLVVLTLGGNLLAETEGNDAAEPEAVEASPSDTIFQAEPSNVSPGSFLASPDFRNARITDGAFGEPSSSAFRMFGAGMFIAAGADLASTEYGLSRPSVYEANPVQSNRTVRILTHTAVPALMYYVTDKLHDDGKHKLALLARIGFTVGYSYVVMHNLRTAAVTP